MIKQIKINSIFVQIIILGNYIGFEKFQKYIELTNKRINQEC